MKVEKLTDEECKELLSVYLQVEFVKGNDPSPLAGKPILDSNGGTLFDRAILEAFRYAAPISRAKLANFIHILLKFTSIG